MNTCNNCGCTPKNDEWSSATLCIDCQHNEEENDDIRTEYKRNNEKEGWDVFPSKSLWIESWRLAKKIH